MHARGERAEPTLADGDGRQRYVLRGVLGEGAVGRVHRAFDLDSGREVALKTLKAVHSDHLYHLKQEFRSLRDIVHPNLVRLHELVVADELAYFTMELVEGVNLLEWVWTGGPPTPGRRLDEEQILRLRRTFSQLASALETLHAHGRLHRDVKPNNVLVTSDGRLVLVDLGISVNVASALGRASMSGRVSGTRGYMSPEQASGHVLSPASDWYTFGVLLHQALTGGGPVGSPVIGWREARLSELEDSAGSTPSDLEQLALALLTPEPDARPSARQVLAALPGARTSSWRLRGTGHRLVGREAESAQLVRGLAQSRATGVHVMTVTGPSGIGKTTLVESFLERAAKEADARILRARCHHREKLPFKALDGIIDDLSEHLRQMPRSELAEYVPARVGALLQVFPLLTRAFGQTLELHRPSASRIPASRQDGSRSDGSRSDGSRSDNGLLRPGALASLRHLLAQLALNRPLVLWVDDLQWADRDSLMALQAIVGPMGVPGYLVVLSYRSVGIEEQRLIGELLADVGPSRRSDVSLGPLEASHVLELVRDVAPTLADPAVVQLVRTSGGMPLLAREFARDLDVHGEVLGDEEVEGRVLLSQLLDLRLANLSDEAKTAFGLLCVAGFPVEERALFRMTGADRRSFALVELAGAGLARDNSERGVMRLEVAHDQLREAFLERAGEEEVARLTAILQQALTATGTSDPLFQVEMLSRSSPQQALALAQDAARRARSRGAVQLEAMLLDRASGLASGDVAAEVMADLGRALLCCGRSQDGASQLSLAADLAFARGDRALATRWRAAAGEHLMAQGHIQEGLAAMTSALATIGVEYERTPARALLWLMLHMPLVAWRKLTYRLGRRSAGSVSQETRVKMAVLWAAGTAVSHSEVIHAMQFHARHALLAYPHSDPLNVALSMSADAVIAAMRGGPKPIERALALIDQARTHAKVADDAATAAFIEAQAAAVHHFAGDWIEVLEQIPTAHVALADASSERMSQTGLLCFLELTALSYLGRLNLMRARAAELKVTLAVSGNGAYEKCLRLGWNQLPGLAWDDLASLEGDLARAEPHLRSRGFAAFDCIHLLARANLELYQGRGASALDLVEAAWPRLRRSLQLVPSVPHFELWELRARAALAAAASGARALRRIAIRLALKSIRALAKNPLSMARPAAESLRGCLALTQGSSAVAAVHLRRAAEQYERLGLELRANACRLAVASFSPEDDDAAARRWFEAEQVVYPDRFVWVLLPAGPAPPRQRPQSQRAAELAPRFLEEQLAHADRWDDTVVSGPRHQPAAAAPQGALSGSASPTESTIPIGGAETSLHSKSVRTSDDAPS